MSSGTKANRAAQYGQPGQLLISSGPENLLANTHRHIRKGKEGKEGSGAAKEGSVSALPSQGLRTWRCMNQRVFSKDEN